MNKIIKSTLRKVLKDEKYNNLQNNHRRAVINKNIAKKEKLIKVEELKKEKTAKKLEVKKENKEKSLTDKKIKVFHENFREIMEEHGIYVREDKTITPFNIEYLNQGGAEGMSCDLAFPKGLSPKNLDKVIEPLAQNVYGKCMVFIEDEVDKHVKLSAIKKWHDIKYAPYLEHKKKKLTASQMFCGYNIRSEPIVLDMAKDPHVMITGGTGGGNVE